jgi:FSR family fosmidomycin resistance protein-like MFS transporter
MVSQGARFAPDQNSKLALTAAVRAAALAVPENKPAKLIIEHLSAQFPGPALPENGHPAKLRKVSSASTITHEKAASRAGAAVGILAAISFSHLLNDMMQSVIPAVYPILKAAYRLDFGQIGLITLTSQLTASLLQPLIGLYTDRRPTPWSLPMGMGFTLAGLLLLAVAPGFAAILLAVACIGIGSAVFHPESSRVARLASGGQHGLAQSIFQVGGNAGSSLGPLLAAFIVLPAGQRSIAWFSAVALLAIGVLWRVGVWYKGLRVASAKRPASADVRRVEISRGRVVSAIGVLIALVFSKYFYLASLVSYYTFFLMNKFHLTVRSAQLHLFLFLGAAAVGTIAGGPIGDRVGRKWVIWFSILGVLPFTLALPYANLFWTSVLTVVIGLIIASAFSAIIVYAQDLVPGKVGTVSGLFFGLAFGMGGVGAALLGVLADHTSIDFVYRVCAFLPVIGLLTAFLPDVEPPRAHSH